MEIDLSELNVAQQAALRKMAQDAISYINTVFIFCFSFQKYESQYTNCFDQDHGQSRFQADVLLVYKDDEMRSESEIRHLINGFSSSNCDYVAVVYSYGLSKELVEQGDAFLSTVFRKGALLYSEGVSLPSRQRFISHESLLQQTREGCIRWFANSAHFMDCAAYCILEGHFGLAIFMIHQVVEQICRALLRVLMHVDLTSHNLAWMLKLCSSLAPGITSLFPRDTPKEKMLFRILKSSYLDSRYAEKFEVKEQDSWVLYERAVALQRIAGKVCAERIRYIEGFMSL